MRHGFAEEYNSEAYLAVLEQVFYMYYTDKRHETGGNPKEETQTFPLQEWRMRDRLKTVSAALVLCLNIGVDPPDVVKTNPCAKLECWHWSRLGRIYSNNTRRLAFERGISNTLIPLSKIPRSFAARYVAMLRMNGSFSITTAMECRSQRPAAKSGCLTRLLLNTFPFRYTICRAGSVRQVCLSMTAVMLGI
ncbi:unnamed protein product [Tuber melanosporum]|uniref:(Perigord truffle) hypothetical protein n=1 Tax=Tuber melanosporum (strain Mel28) TaxID=656061 RepID=D5G7Z4_TUBMM|nr:uncharacterized protein GSTUM_00002742001 [Tuber melanosporum]CAZ80637.1 unnamed protein product [Tuber melanosporum]